MSFFSRFSKKEKSPQALLPHPLPITVFSSQTTNPFSFADMPEQNFAARRQQARTVMAESLIAKNIVQRLCDNVVNAGLSWESTPIWDLIKDAPKSEDERKKFTRKIENKWKLYANSKEADWRGQFTLQQLQVQIFKKFLNEGEFFAVIRYLNSHTRLSPVTIQILNNDQIVQPTDSALINNAKKRGNSIVEGIEFDSTGAEVAIYVLKKMGETPVRILFFGEKSKRQFVIHGTNHQFRGKSRLADMVYELDRLSKYDEAELEATVTASKFVAAVEYKNEYKQIGNRLAGGISLGGARKTAKSKTPEGLERQEIDGQALIINNLPPGAEFKGYQPNRPNANYEKFVDSFCTRLAGLWGMPLSIFKMLFSSSYSAGRAEVLLFWNSVQVFRADFVSGFLNDFKKAVVSEWEKKGELKMDGFGVPAVREAWLYGSWTGISRPVVDPVREINAIKSRIAEGHTTRERESKAFNGSDFIENIDRLKIENEELAKARGKLEQEAK